jgi:hypothetical protein
VEVGAGVTTPQLPTGEFVGASMDWTTPSDLVEHKTKHHVTKTVDRLMSERFNNGTCRRHATR